MKLITKIEEKILEDEENILEQINQKKLEWFLSTKYIT